MKKTLSIILAIILTFPCINVFSAENSLVGVSAAVATFVHNSSANANKTGAQINSGTLIAGRGREVFLQFDISMLDAESIKNVTLYLTTEHGGGNNITINYLPNNNWNKNITYNTKPDTAEETKIVSLKTGSGNRTEGTYSRLETDVTQYIKNAKNTVSFHITGGDNAAEFASLVSDYPDRSPMLFVSYGDAAQADYDKVISEAEEYLLGGVNIIGKISDYKASNGITVSFTWNEVYDTTIDDEKGAYKNNIYLTSDGSVKRPKWYEGTKSFKCKVTMSAGTTSKQISDVRVKIKPYAVPGFKEENLSNYIDVGNVESEEYSGTKRLESTRDNGVQTKTIDGTVHTYRSLNKCGAMSVTLKCSPEKTNYLTVKLWGDDTGDTMLWVCDPVTGCMNTTNTRQPVRNGLVDRKDWVELNTLGSSPQYNGGFIYATYMIPTIYTNGKNYVSLRIYSTGGAADYSNVSIKEQTEASRGIYAVYMTDSAYFNPETFETVSGALKSSAEPEMISLNKQKEVALTYIKDAVSTFKNWQIYGRTNYPSYMEGMITRGTGWRYKYIGDSDWKSVYYNNSGMLKQNLTPLNGYEVFAVAYTHADELGYDAQELLDRTVKGIDFLVRAQGENGAFNSANGWIGGPTRTDGGGNNLTGFGLKSAAKAILLISEAADENGYFAEMIDSDADGVADMNRKQAWQIMMAKARDYLVTLDGTGHAPNQDMANITAALRLDRALQLMGSSLVWDEAERKRQFDIAFGFDISKACSSYWVSPKGLILENFGSIQGGYSGDYGMTAISQLGELCELAVDCYGNNDAQKYIDRYRLSYENAGKFLFVANAYDAAAPTLFAEGIISTRNGYYPGIKRYVLDSFAALSQNSKTALKIYEYFISHNALTNNSNEFVSSNAHFEDNILDILELYLNFDQITAAIENMGDYELLMEDDSIKSHAWADEMGRNVVIKNNGDKIYLALNWRNPLHSTTYYNTVSQNNAQQTVMNNLARFHHKTDAYDRYGYAQVNTEDWTVRTQTQSEFKLLPKHYVDAFMYLSYGDYKIVMNSSNLLGEGTAKQYKIPTAELELNGIYKDLIRQKYYSFGKSTDGVINGDDITVDGATTLVLYPAFLPVVNSIKYEGQTVAVSISTTLDDETGKDISVYVAEYNQDGVLASVRKEDFVIKKDTDISFTHQKQQNTNVSIFVWDNDLAPVPLVQ